MIPDEDVNKWGLDLKTPLGHSRAPEMVSFAALAHEIKRRIDKVHRRNGVIPFQLQGTLIDLYAKADKCQKLHQKQQKS
ncbi:MAG: hypothetical protein EKK48_12135 [Candidatus Melainabacteria bacterium]|nr:MAG: hypothetical protein EKK48_12135 [Candidatus Melainabacteria bacterium]